jgi:type I restriction enzyme S subunit
MSAPAIARTDASAARLRRFKPYPAYQDSGAEWLGEIPAHWVVERLRSTISGSQNGVWGDEPDGVHDVICVRVADFNRIAFTVDITDPTLRSIEPRAMAARELRPGDLLLEKSGGGEQQPVGAVVMYDHSVPAVCSNFIARLTIASEYDSRFLTYLHAALYSQRINTRHIKQSTGIQNLDSPSYFGEKVGIPPAREQRAIAALLDRETARIDALIARKKGLIELLQEKRAALITQAVTKGLDPSVPMKDPGVEWLGEIPAHWEAERIKWKAAMVSGHTPDKKVDSYWQDGDIPWVSLADTQQLREVDYIANTAVMTTADGIAHSSAHLLPPGTVVFSRDATIGLCAITRGAVAVSQHFIGWVCGSHLQPEYLLFVLRSMTEELERVTMGATVSTIGMTDVRRLVAPIPPMQEQQEIVLHIQRQRAQLDTLIGKVSTAIARLKEFRIALISAAITGKIDVREEVA